MLADVLVLFGATGDLAQKKLYKALLVMHKDGRLSKHFRIVGASRRDWTNKEYHAFIKQHTSRAPAAFLKRFTFQKVELDNSADYENLAKAMGSCTPLFYLAVAPRFFPVIAQQLKEHGVAAGARLMFEKPFGHDLESAQELNKQLSQNFKEEQIYRLDHYLGKDSIQNLLVLRMANHVFESVWNRRHIDNIQISVSETIGIGDRGPSYYDKAGALRDMVQNHLLQILTYIAMEPPSTIAPDDVQTEKVKVLKNLTFTKAVFGQYGKGQHKAYTEEAGIKSTSRTETYVALKGEINNLRWQGVPFYLRTGKRLKKKEGKVTITFKNVPTNLFSGLSDNQLVIRFQPEHQILFRFNTTTPAKSVAPVEMEFCHGTHFLANSPEAYEEIIDAAIRGDKNMFTRWDEAEAQWRVMRTIRKTKVQLYEPGTWGPPAGDKLVGGAWQ